MFRVIFNTNVKLFFKIKILINNKNELCRKRYREMDRR